MINKKWNKRGFLIRDVVLSALIFFGIIALFLFLVNSVATNYSRPDMISSKFSDNYNKLYVLTGGDSGIETTRSSVGQAGGLQLLGNFDIAFSSTWTAFNMIWATVDLYASMGSNLISDFTFIDAGVIKIVMYVLVMALTVIIIFSIISSVMRGRV